MQRIEGGTGGYAEEDTGVQRIERGYMGIYLLRSIQGAEDRRR